jgi:protein SCO1
MRGWLLLVAMVSLLLGAPVYGARTGSGPGGDFTLTDQTGARFRLSDHRGRVILLFFGYTSCTEACPVTLGRINSVFKELGPDRERALAVFVSVDPERDTTSVLREYVEYFPARAIALTGTRAEIDAVVERYGARYEIERSDSALGYHVSHTTDIFVIDRLGVLQSRFKHTDHIATLTAEVRRLLQ